MRLEPSKSPLPEPLFCLIGMWPATAACVSALQPFSTSVDLAVLVFSLALGVCALVCIAKGGLSRAGGGPRWYMCALAVLLGLAMGLAGAASSSYGLHRARDALEVQHAQSFVVQIIEDVQDSEFGQHAIALARNDAGDTFKVRVNLPENSQARCWDVFEMKGSIKAPSVQAAAYYWRKGCVGSLTPHRVQVRRADGPLGCLAALRSAGVAVYQGKSDGSLLLRSVALGDRQELFSSAFYGRVKRAGLAHLVAVSGAHLSITLAAAGLLLSRLRASRRICVAAQAALGMLFVVFVGAPPSAIRALFMALCAMGASLAARRSFALNALSLCVVCFIMLDPHASLSVSLALSALSTFGIVLFSGLLSKWFAVLFGHRAEGVCDLLGMTCAALLCTLPVTATMFSQISLIAPLGNLVAAPFFAFLCVGGLLGALLGACIPGFHVLAQAMVAPADAFCQAITLLGRIPYAATVTSVSAPIVVALAVLSALALYHFWPIPSRIQVAGMVGAASVLIAGAIVLLPATHGTEIVALDVGQGDAILLRSGQHAVLVDTGNQDTMLLSGLARHHVRHLDAVVISHPDDDHCGSLPTLLDFVEVDCIMVAHDLLGCACDNCSLLCAKASTEPLVGLNVGDIVHWGCFSAQVLWPIAFQNAGGNEDSVVLRVEADCNYDGVADASALLVGDAEEEVLSHLAQAGALASVDVYKVGHHGSKGAFAPDQLSLLSPRIALVSVGAQNRYGHPDRELIEEMERQEVGVFRTDERGDVVCRIGEGSIRVDTLR